MTLGPIPCFWEREARDVVFHDGLAKLCPGNGPQNTAIVKHMAMNLVRNPKDRSKPGASSQTSTRIASKLSSAKNPRLIWKRS